MVSTWITLVAIGVATFAYRASFILFSARLHLPKWLQQALRFVPVAALTAIIVPELLTYNGMPFISWQNERLLAGMLAVGVAWWSRNITLTLLLGMGALYLLQWWGAA